MFTRFEYMSNMAEVLRSLMATVCSDCRKHNSALSSFMYQRVCSKSKATGALCGTGMLTPPEHLCSPPRFSGVRVARSLVSCVMFSRSLFVLLSFSFWPLYCLSFCDLRLPITSLESSNFCEKTRKLLITREHITPNPVF